MSYYISAVSNTFETVTSFFCHLPSLIFVFLSDRVDGRAVDFFLYSMIYRACPSDVEINSSLAKNKRCCLRVVGGDNYLTFVVILTKDIRVGLW